MKRVHRSEDGKYHVKGASYSTLVGSRAQVYHKTAYKTPGGLVRGSLLKNKHGRIVSAKKHATAKKEKRLQKHGYFTKKGKFGSVKRTVTRKVKKSKRKSKNTRRK